ncbi:MAG: hypothetical protein B7Y36_06690 [Novosphingobium sp. 28-62-57]|uniref:type II toxin-antitoxin system VapC family toxin n=1 Tax=unclassified Novosphingobium TaxID=2644732 RepID=UPI000BCA27C3|nr:MULTISPECIES: type II toxin-antitoxin system VapC family toxin [unclassified Novosphingobium]OYW51130.1 MAG: hypothetical protein B7Z34_02330 [Novosphingobium sp. 12-62-10]OYZ11049.1 MAG: hypothetical protein B7Y36_06690 [Novosphingobium sp. 28-62-57]OZA39107.1 MAG: hypothetical protein B7X92_03075 [Novosphingobium sp. 17-62-9]HQS68772.1 type II toxin-antitoxin system VapC family toxin [Novosphingobium sp.]
MAGVLLDTHALYWLVSGEQALANDALFAIGESQAAGSLVVSPISAWELAVAARKNRAVDRPHFGNETPYKWFRDALVAVQAKPVAIHQRIAIEAAKVVEYTGHKDPGDCFLIATARVRRVPLITRDAIIIAIANDDPGYLTTIYC